MVDALCSSVESIQKYYAVDVGLRNARLNFKALIFMLVFFSVGFSMIAPVLLIVLEGCSFSEIVAIMKDEPLFILTGIIGGFVATFWQGIGKLFGHNLKTEYGIADEDQILEQIVVYYEAGLL